ncbi:Glycosylphosphatidylinositol anchor biosynthesis protein 11 [Penicillium oxalicum]|uniref:Glycosylphosphatidylinositol anchor biosynthesis protein 11 n=1 Tax=Penicillium oxalicum (strain 114-2 / CGMCC 5302) TaxID=933388 RepID=S7ZCW5_PENO1|nr:Glycosylphosphatidylinositol anchor biosynthesis protein 11 [Penicillium oxalicum]EPS28114.1 hypothetical protein PDE_03060 [Penicillium oxalicum 114-2]KAI2789059.1 Glycosylphosphatidylinositol anchor biosynthesis protein 11 [Penicillium oxalicum]
MASSNVPQNATSPGSLSQAPAEKPSAPPVNVLPSPLAQTYSLVHPLVLLGLCAYRFEALVANPAQELLADLPWLAALQFVYVICCLPPAGSSSSEAHVGVEDKKKASRSSAGSSTPVRSGKVLHRRKSPSKISWASVWSRLMPACLAFGLTSLLATPAIAVLLVLFGAPLTTHNVETFLCAAHMGLLSSTALVYVHGVDSDIWKEVGGISRPADVVWGSALGTGLGAWFGAIPIPLDWDRPWQAFPITIVIGAYIGHALGGLISRTSLLYGKRIQFAPEQVHEDEKKTN